MPDSRSTYEKYNWLNWLAIVILSFNLFSFSGLLNNNFSVHNLFAKTELLVSKKNSPVSVISYHQALTNLHNYIKSNSLPFLKSWIFYISQHHNRLSVQKINNCRVSFLNHPFSLSFLPKKIISSQSDDDLAHPLLG